MGWLTCYKLPWLGNRPAQALDQEVNSFRSRLLCAPNRTPTDRRPGSRRSKPLAGHVPETVGFEATAAGVPPGAPLRGRTRRPANGSGRGQPCRGGVLWGTAYMSPAQPSPAGGRRCSQRALLTQLDRRDDVSLTRPLAGGLLAGSAKVPPEDSDRPSPGLQCEESQWGLPRCCRRHAGFDDGCGWAAASCPGSRAH